MDSNLPYFSLPFVDSSDLDFGKIRDQECEYDDLHPTLPSHGSLLGADDDVLAQFLSEDDPLEEPDLNGPTTLHCEICRKQFDNAKKYYGHLRVHSKDNLWTCEQCPEKKFSSKQQLMKHTLTHQPLAKVWRCPQCEMSFEALWRLQQHLFATHLDYRPHKCDLCTKSFHKLSDLDKHRNIHAVIKKYACNICKRKFGDKSNLKRHMLTHSNEKPYSCVGCGHWFKQIASMKRHSLNCPMVQNSLSDAKKSYRNNYCRVCGLTFQYKSSLLEHCVREHSNDPAQPPPEPPKEDKYHQLHVDTNRTVDKIVDDILSAEDDYMTMSTQNDLINNYPAEENQDNLMQIELLKEINQMHNMHHILDDELLYNDIDLDTFQTMCNNIDYERNELFDLNDGRSMDHIMNGKSLDQDFMNAIVRGIEQEKDELPKEFLNPPEMNSKVNEFLVNPPVSVNECSTIFESDVDLEASTNLAANLNQLIGENTVQYISTEHDDTFIISLNSEIDAEQLTDMLNIGVEKPIPKPTKIEPDFRIQPETKPVLSIELNPLSTAEKCKEKVEPEKTNTRMKIKYVCLICKRIFKTKHNYTSHRATHDPDLQQFQCTVCFERFCYKSTLNKHTRKKHTPIVKTAHTCHLCDKNYTSAWQLKQHTERVHELLQPYQCNVEDCGKKFYKKSDLVSHSRCHTGERPYVCDTCSRGFKTVSHLARHVRRGRCTKHVTKENNVKRKTPLLTTNNSKKKENKSERTNATNLLVTTQNSKIEGINSEVPQNGRLLVVPMNSKIEEHKTARSKTARTATHQNSKMEVINSEIPENGNFFVIPMNSKIGENKTKRPNTAKTATPQKIEGINSGIPKYVSLFMIPMNSKTEGNKTTKPNIAETATPQDSKMEGIYSEMPKNGSVFVIPVNTKIEENKRPQPAKNGTHQNLKMKGINSEIPETSSLFVIPMNSKIEDNKILRPKTAKTATTLNLKIEENKTRRPEKCLLTPQNLIIEEYKTRRPRLEVFKAKRRQNCGLILRPQILNVEKTQSKRPKIEENKAKRPTTEENHKSGSIIIRPQILKVEKTQSKRPTIEENKAKRPTTEENHKSGSIIIRPHILKVEKTQSKRPTIEDNKAKRHTTEENRNSGSITLRPQIFEVEKIQAKGTKIKEHNIIAMEPRAEEKKAERPKSDITTLLTPHHLKITMSNSSFDSVQHF